MTPQQYHELIGFMFLIGAANCPHKNTLRPGIMIGAAIFHLLIRPALALL